MTVQADAYELALDLDRDGYFTLATNPTDPLNLVPSPVRWRGLAYVPNTFFSSAVLSDEATDYGVKILTVDTAGEFGGGVYIGKNSYANTFSVPCTPLTTYTYSVWVKEISNGGSDEFLALLVTDNHGTDLNGGPFFTPTTSWVQYSTTFTTKADSTALVLFIYKRAGYSGEVLFKATGFMLVAGASAPANFNAGNPTNFYENIMPYVESVDWTYGCTQYSEAVAPPSQMTITVNNSGGQFLPGAGAIGSAVTKGMIVRLRASYNGSYYPLYIGTLDTIRFSVGIDGDRHAILIVTDPMPQLLNALYTPVLQQNVTTDQVLQKVFDSYAITYPNPGWYWILGTPGYSEVGVTTWLLDNALTNFETGATTFAFAGDITGADASLNAQSFLREYVYGELGGRFFWDAPSAQFKFFNRNHDVNAAPSALSPGVLELDEPPDYLFADDLLNRVTVNYYPRITGVAGSVLYPSPTSPITLTAKQAYTFTARYQDPNAPNAQVAASTTIYPVAGLDYIANSASDGSGSDQTAFVTVSVNPLATSAQVTLVNNSGSTVYLTTFQLRGTPLTAYTRATVVNSDGISLGSYGDFPRTVEITTLGDAVLAQSYASYLVQRYKTPLARIGGASIWGNRDAATLLNALTLGVGSAVELDDAFLQNVSNKYVITALHHTLTPIRHHWVRLSLEPLDRSLYWILGDATLSILNTTTRLSI